MEHTDIEHVHARTNIHTEDLLMIIERSMPIVARYGYVNDNVDIIYFSRARLLASQARLLSVDCECLCDFSSGI